MKQFLWTNWAGWTATENRDVASSAKGYCDERSNYYKSIGWMMRVYYIS